MAQKIAYQFGHSQLTIEFGDIVTSEAQVIVSSDDCDLTMSGGVSAAIRRAGGDDIALDAAKKIPAALGSVVVTTAGRLPAHYIFHVITIPSSHAAEAVPDEVLQKATQRCMELVEVLGVKSIAFPALGAGSARFPLDRVAAQMAKTIAAALLKVSVPSKSPSIFSIRRDACGRWISFRSSPGLLRGSLNSPIMKQILPKPLLRKPTSAIRCSSVTATRTKTGSIDCRRCSSRWCAKTALPYGMILKSKRGLSGASK